MQHSIAAKYAARPTARFVLPAGRGRERRLGLRRTISFQPAARPQTVLRRADRGQLAGRHGAWRLAGPRDPSRTASGIPRPAVVYRWTRFWTERPERPSSAAAAPWRA